MTRRLKSSWPESVTPLIGFECAIHSLAPVCPHCNCRIVGHGVEADGKIFCCVHCARASGTTQLKDRV